MVSNRFVLPSHFQRAVSAELLSGETVLYAGRPNWRASWGWMAAALLFGLFWSAISFTFFGIALGGLLGLTTIKSGNGPASTGLLVFLLIFSLPFVAVGIGVLAAPFIGIRRSARTVHVVTDQRVMNVCLAPPSVESYALHRVNFLKRRDRADGSGTLQIGYGVEKDSDGDPRPLTLDWAGIPEVKSAEQAIREQARWVR